MSAGPEELKNHQSFEEMYFLPINVLLLQTLAQTYQDVK